MKTFLRIMMVLSLGMMIFNVTQVDWSAPMQGKSTVAVIGILAAGSAFLLLFILMLSLKIKEQQKKR